MQATRRRDIAVEAQIDVRLVDASKASLLMLTLTVSRESTNKWVLGVTIRGGSVTAFLTNHQ